ncbi:uncharacterized protein BYT42DRAFT_613272 [Radiomyces spectabilis]|uniref:uncharacterized protein n=1 Tax=Radiomyces spectabilis TaxID=64574 RepID=UPI00221FB78F|nr:uncharacterized protein BYT42DRAFT_613272 [Radiomyces spectabilis]KAI8381499.1 hypothetical protein BYT42DRAFT_613272 [Radiomyces spectabilis]
MSFQALLNKLLPTHLSTRIPKSTTFDYSNTNHDSCIDYDPSVACYVQPPSSPIHIPVAQPTSAAVSPYQFNTSGLTCPIDHQSPGHDLLSVPSTAFGSFSSAADSIVTTDHDALFMPLSSQQMIQEDFCLDDLLDFQPSTAVIPSAGNEHTPFSPCSTTMASSVGASSQVAPTPIIIQEMYSPFTDTLSSASVSSPYDSVYGLASPLSSDLLFPSSFPSPYITEDSPGPLASSPCPSQVSIDQLMEQYLVITAQSPCLSDQEIQPVASAGSSYPREKRSMRRSARLHKCPYCTHTSNRANNMKEHIRTHDPNRPKNFACSICDKRFARKHDMKRHTKSHQRLSRRSTS